MILYDAVPSANSERVRIALHEKALEYRRVTLVLARKEQKSAQFLKLNPHGKVPVLDDGGKVLFESLIINQYLDEEYPHPPLQPKDPYLRARGRMLVDYALNLLHEPYWALRGEMMKDEPERSSALLADKRGQLAALLDYLEAALDGKPYLAGEFSLADIDVWPRLSRLEKFGALQQPGLKAWLGRMNQRPSVAPLVA